MLEMGYILLCINYISIKFNERNEHTHTHTPAHTHVHAWKAMANMKLKLPKLAFRS